jgi:hypothetical protein
MERSNSILVLFGNTRSPEEISAKLKLDKSEVLKILRDKGVDV